MQRLMIALFAHPDDEAFGPSGTLLTLRDEGYDLHLILLTDGEGGTNPDQVADLAATRRTEWQAATKLLGATTTHALHFPDGTLDQLSEEQLDTAVTAVIRQVLHHYTEPTQVSFMTFEPQGLTGHHDHIVASRCTTRMALQFHAHAIWYFCLGTDQAPLDGTAYYEPRAREDDYISTRIDVTPYLEQKYQIMDTHFSQRADADAMKKLGDTTERFHIDSF